MTHSKFTPMCFGKKEKPQPSASPQQKSGPQGEPAPRWARNPPQVNPPQASLPQLSQPRASDQRPVSRRQSRSGRPVAQRQNHMDSQPPQERSSRRVKSLPLFPQPRASDQQQQASRRLSGLGRPAVPLGATLGSDRGIIIAVMGVMGKIRSLFKTSIDWLR